MAKFYDALTDTVREFIAQQQIFFTATAPASGRVNLSPKGLNSFRCLDERTVAYLDLTGSGNETAAHLRENGRITLMFCSFADKPLILRLYGQGRVIRPRDPEWAQFHAHFDALPAERQIIVVDVQTVQTSCGYGVPLYDYVGERETLARWAEKKGEQGIRDYWREKNQRSIDGLPTHILED
ncbi:pyridoxamine 5'-phosphate oxidase family protein [Thermithiobacillus tepidarius DSM 3134]|uniref:pyridoxamine 5'-phosphate oxidase family protein n=1 Tax=Thermithiobacillus tepidarius TaxID=929 RepID=UPI000423A7A6|nr:pyridoxamine 5'-phosphate oxidase family protein [Thermithiobacillus tepidarius]